MILTITVEDTADNGERIESSYSVEPMEFAIWRGTKHARIAQIVDQLIAEVEYAKGGSTK